MRGKSAGCKGNRTIKICAQGQTEVSLELSQCRAQEAQTAGGAGGPALQEAGPRAGLRGPEFAPRGAGAWEGRPLPAVTENACARAPHLPCSPRRTLNLDVHFLQGEGGGAGKPTVPPRRCSSHALSDLLPCSPGLARGTRGRPAEADLPGRRVRPPLPIPKFKERV
jgi:hypothetical protein